ncbi:MAG: Homing endonuclease LAGLIDADG/HNH [Parcubacteria group bacterium Athens0714_26]|nr:MAG: Homing endonuclease LAGLIDADG/HNH [Parcubacteria group bacterium Athens1014_26]TSD02864.1 MAG: Homing endonuclease LAGLIDADG/HNH [Parcubacteria group bacterium Athens0714_26]
MALILSKKVIGADNQQERLKIANWICGFVDGEGCFSVSVIKNKTTKFGNQIFPEFVITQGAKSLTALEEIKNFFGCGRIFINKRYDNHNENLYRYCVRCLSDLENKIIPFFLENKLRTFKKKDFIIFKKVIKIMSSKKHLNKSGRNKILRLISKMNRRKKRF